MRHRPEIDLLVEAYAKVHECNDCQMPTSAIIEVQPEPTGLPGGHCAAAQSGCDCDGCPECKANQQGGDHDPSEIHMAKAELKKAAEYAQKLSVMLDSLHGLEGWTAAKITKASDYLSSVYHWLDYENSQDQEQGMYNLGAEDC